MPKKVKTKVSVSKAVRRAEKKNSAAQNKNTKSRMWIYLYWVMIVMFVTTACYILSVKENGNVEITEESLTATEPSPTTDATNEYTDSGRQRLISGDVAGALNDFTVAIERDQSATNYIYRGETLMAGANFDAAIADFDSAARIDPRSVVAYYDRALANIKLENLDQAKNDLDRAIEVYAQHPDPEQVVISIHNLYAKRAQVNLWLRDWDMAESDYTAAISQNLGDQDWNDFTGRAEARTNKGNYEGAISDYVSAVTIISDRIQKTPDAKSRENMSRNAMVFFEKSGAIRVKLGQIDLAMQDLDAAHTLAIALGDNENKDRLQILISSLAGR